MIANAYPETADEVFALLPSLKVWHGTFCVTFIQIINGRCMVFGTEGLTISPTSLLPITSIKRLTLEEYDMKLCL